jgi:hypothetical protein
MLTTVKFQVAPLSHPSFTFTISSAKSNMMEVTSVSRRRVHLQIRYSPIPDSVGSMASQKGWNIHRRCSHCVSSDLEHHVHQIWQPQLYKHILDTKGVFGSPVQQRYSHLNPSHSSICCLLARVGPTRHCRTHAKNSPQPGRVAKLKSSFTTRPS